MVIINKHSHTKRHAAVSKKSFVSVLAIVLSLLMMASVLLVAVPTVSAKGESPFVDCEEIFIDMRSFTGWTDGSASFRVFTFYNDSDDAHYCHEFAGNFDNDGWYTGSNVLQAGIQAVKFANNVYSFRIPANNLSHLRIVRTNSNSTEKWNLSPHMWDNQRSKYTADGKSYSKQNCIKITGWDNSASWSTFTPANNASYSEVTANPDSSITGNSNLYTIDATFYDYYTDDEVQNGWGNIRYSTNHANGTTGAYWEPYQVLNSKIASQGSSVNYPLYFGNFYDKGDGYQGEGSSNMTNFSNWVNNSSRLGGANKSVVGLTGSTLVNGDLYYAADGGGNSSTKVPIFDKSWLSTNKVGSVVNTKFPMRKVVNNGVTTYAFDSSSSAANGGDNVWLNSSHNTISYGAGTSKGAKDALYYYSAPQENSGYGFFPFDSTRGTSAEANNFGFGMRVDVKFNLGADDSSHIGQIKGTNGSYVNQEFNFTGDDDVWVYIDGKLILDLGGDHKKANGKINFHDRSVSVTTGTNTLNSATRNTSFTLDNYGDPTAEHTLTMFYVERGMVESNLSFNFNFAPVGNEFIVDKTVNTANINAGIQSAVAAADTFSFNQPTANGKVSSKGTISDSTYTLKNGERISFQDQFTRGQTFTVTESESSPLDYTTTWSAKDLVMNESRGSGSTKTANFTYDTSNTSEFAMTRVQLSYVNTPQVGSVAVAKTLEGGGTEEFGATVRVSLDGGTTYGYYPLTYTVSDKAGTYTLGSNGSLNSNAKLKNGRTLTFSNLPRGAKVEVVENLTTSQGASYRFKSISGADTTLTNGGIVTVGASQKTMTITNTTKSGGAQLNAKKTLGGKNYSGDMFLFTLQGLPVIDNMNNTSTESVTQFVDSISNGNITFDLDNLSVGTYCYVMYEEPINTGNTQVDKEISINPNKQYYLVKVVMAESGGTLQPTVTYYSANQSVYGQNIFTGDWEFNVSKSDFADGKIVSTPTYENLIEKPYVEINKKNQADGTITTPTKFAIYKVANNGADYETGTLVAEKSTVNGTVKFDNLDLYKAGYENAGAASALKYQWYAIVEAEAPSGYRQSKETIYVQFPINGDHGLTYHAVYDYVNGIIRNPYTAGNGMDTLRLVGMSLVGMSLLVLAGFVLYKKRNRLSFSKAKHYK